MKHTVLSFPQAPVLPYKFPSRSGGADGADPNGQGDDTGVTSDEETADPLPCRNKAERRAAGCKSPAAQIATLTPRPIGRKT